MKALTQFLTPSCQFHCLAWLTAVLSLVILPNASAEISFVDTDTDFSTTVDTDTDSDGLTYVIGTLGARTLPNGWLDESEAYLINSGANRDLSNASVAISPSATVIKKIDTAGVLVSWVPDKPNLTHLIIPELDSPTSIHLAANGSIYLVGTKGGSSRLLRLNQTTGLRTAINSDFAGTVAVTDIAYSEKNDKVYMTGYYDPTNSAVRVGDFVRTDYDRNDMGARAAFLVRMNPNLVVNHHSYFGANGGWTVSNSITTDETGAVYIAGRYGAGGTVNGFLQPSGASGGGRGFVIKYNSSHSGIKEYHGGTSDLLNLMVFRELHYSQGWIYAVGDQGNDNDGDFGIVKLDTELKEVAMAKVESDANLIGRSVTSDEAGNVYVAGRYGPGSAELIDPEDADNETEFTISTSQQAVFVAKLKPDFVYDWVRTPNATHPSSFGGNPTVRWNKKLQRVVWAGAFSGGSLTMGEPHSPVTAGGPAGFVSLLEPEGTFTQRVKLSIFSEFGKTVSQLKPFGNPIDPNPSDPNSPDAGEIAGVADRSNTKLIIKGTEITAAAPRFLYRNILGADITDDLAADDEQRAQEIDQFAETRIASTGFSINDIVQEGDAAVHTFLLDRDTRITFNWRLDYALRIKNSEESFDGTLSREIIGGQTPRFYVDRLTSEASGNPEPSANKHWIAKDEPVIVKIDGNVVDLFTDPGLNIRTIVRGYLAYGSANPNTDNAAEDLAVFGQIPVPGGEQPDVANLSGLRDFESLNFNERRLQLPEEGEGFTMYGPGGITFIWGLQYGVQVNTASLETTALPRIEVVHDPRVNLPGLKGLLPPQVAADGSGVHWFDDGTRLKVGTREFDDLNNRVEGWVNGDGNKFGATGTTAVLTAEFSAGGKRHLAREINLTRPARVMWTYGEEIFVEKVFIGNAVVFNTLPPFPDDRFAQQEARETQPEIIEVNNEPEGSAPGDMAIWDDNGKRLYPLRPGDILLKWNTDINDPSKFVKIRVSIQYKPKPHYPHIAGTPPVSLDPDPVDEMVFREIKFSENDANVDDDDNFTAQSPGRTVLQFGRLSRTGRGEPKEFVEVRVVQTMRWDDVGVLAPEEEAIIGQKITSPYHRDLDPGRNPILNPNNPAQNGFDRAGLGTGYVFFENARYNPFIYDRTKFIGRDLLNRDDFPGPVISVNLHPGAQAEERLVVVWYDDPEVNDKMLWPHKSVVYNPRWPLFKTDPDAEPEKDDLQRIVIASRFGNENVDADGNNQIVAAATTIDGEDFPEETTYNPTRFQQLQIYNQPDRSIPGYNANEEHALIAPSLRFADVSPRPFAAYALRNNDLNNTARNDDYTSDPYILTQYFDTAEGQFKMRVYQVFKDDSPRYTFAQTMLAGEPVIPFYPLPIPIGATPCPETFGVDGRPDLQMVYWEDHKGSSWAVSGTSLGGPQARFFGYFYYPLTPDFWWPLDEGKMVGDCVAFLPADRNATGSESFLTKPQPIVVPKGEVPQAIRYDVDWPKNLPILKVGETLTFAGGEYRFDNPTRQLDKNGDGTLETVETPGLPGVLAWSAGEVVYDDLNPIMDDQEAFTKYTARLFQALEERFVVLPIDNFPAELLPANGRTKVEGVNYQFTELSASMQKRILYNPLNGRLSLKGFLNDKDIGDPTLTSPPPPLYVLELNLLTSTERDELLSLSDEPSWTAAVDTLYNKARNPGGLDQGNNGVDAAYRLGLEPKIKRDERGQALTETDAFGVERVLRDKTKAAQLQALGVGLALTANPDFLDPLADTPPVSYVTLAENNNPSLGGTPVTLHIIQVDRRQRYRGAIKTVFSDNVFDENVILRHSGDFGGNADKLVFEWWYRPEDGIPARPPNEEMNIPGPNPWLLFADPSGKQGRNFFQAKLKGNPNAPEALIADTLWYVRYRHINDIVDGVDWELNQPRGESKVNFQWAGAANSTPQDQDGDGLPDYRPQLSLGWVKRVLDAVNPYEARIRDFGGDSPATYTSMIRQFGPRFEGPVALNPDKNVIENVGLIQLYTTVLERAMDLSINLSTPISSRAITNALQLASTRISDFYVILGNEAYTDALDPTIGYGSTSVEYGSLAPAVHAFQNQVSSIIDEELALLRGADDFKGRPVYNRLFWNFTKGEGEAAYAQNYNLFDVNEDGFIDETDGLILYPQGHGDAWGHYLTAVRAQYDLLRHPFFNWVSRSELYNLLDVVFDVDFLDERKFAQAAAAKAKAGAEIVNLTYRSKYVEAPEGQWQGYKDVDELRSWGVEEWSRRAGQGAYFDWVTANALLPSEHPNKTLEGLQKVDRTTNSDIAVISSNLNEIQKTFDEANNGFNPLGLAGNVVPFDINPAKLGRTAFDGTTHFEQVWERAVKALENAVAVSDNANQTRNMLRKIGNTEEEFQRSVFKEDLAFRNKLIQIFGRPYDGTIGTGQAYPPGYLGPDTMLHMYVDVLDITEDTVPQAAQGFVDNFDAAVDDNIILGSFVSVPNGYRKLHAESFTGSDPAAYRNNFNGVNYTGPGGFGDENETNRVAIRNMNLPITTQGYAFQAPPAWGQRSAPGKLQLHLNKMLQKEAELARAIANWDGFQGGLVREVRKVVATDNLHEQHLALELSKTLADGILNTVITGFEITSAGAEAFQEVASDADEAIEDFSPNDLPTAGLSFSPGSIPGDVIDGAAQVITTNVKGVLRLTQLTADVSKLKTELFKGIADDLFDFGINEIDRQNEIREALTDLENMAGDEGILRVEIFRQLEGLRELSDQYRSILQEGVRLLEEREAFNKRAAAITQRSRYQDMTFRVSRNDALQKYRDAFDLAAQYTYLAAKAYDYETNLDPSDAASAQGILTEIVRHRGLGHFSGGQPRLGKGGLSDALAWMKVNHDSLKGQLGFNNPQTETGRFSLRTEKFRIPADPAEDAAWQGEMMDALHPNLWELPEFRLFCRPFAAYDPTTPEPGLVIDFTSEINSGKNYFGKSLGGGDHAYDSTNFATKIRSVGVWFEGYLSSDIQTDLSETPRVYLVPVGTDVMSIPTDGALATRSWNVLDQRIPRPLPARSADLDDPTWRPADSLDGILGDRRRFSSFRAYHDSGFFDESEMSFDSRLIGRSVWNTRWLLIIPGRTLLENPDDGLETFINSVSDIKLFFQTYGYSGG